MACASILRPVNPTGLLTHPPSKPEATGTPETTSRTFPCGPREPALRWNTCRSRVLHGSQRQQEHAPCHRGKSFSFHRGETAPPRKPSTRKSPADRPPKNCGRARATPLKRGCRWEGWIRLRGGNPNSARKVAPTPKCRADRGRCRGSQCRRGDNTSDV